jgi:hypothetical protein
MSSSNKILLALESIAIVPATVVLSMLAARAGAEAAGIKGGSWGWGFMLALPLGLVLGFLLSGITLTILKQKNRFRFFPVLFSAGIVSVIVFIISFIVHGLLKIIF